MNCAHCLHTGYLTTRDGSESPCPACRPKPVAHPDPRGAMEAAVRAVTPHSIARRNDECWAVWAVGPRGYLYELTAFRTLEAAMREYPGVQVSQAVVA